MKKLAIILAFLMMVPGAAFGLEMMNDKSMDDVTGQSGVSIAMDDIQIFMNIDKIAWIDCDGYDCVTGTTVAGSDGNAGAVGISNFQLDVLNINAPDQATLKTDLNGTGALAGTSGSNLADATTDTSVSGVFDLSNNTACSQIDLQFDYGNTAQASCQLAQSGSGDLGTQTAGLNNYQAAKDVSSYGDRYTPAPLTIDATSQLPVLSTAKTSVAGSQVNVGGVLIGLPTVEVYIPTMSMTPEFYNVDGHEPASNAAGVSDADYGTIAMEGITFTVLSGWLEIAPH